MRKKPVKVFAWVDSDMICEYFQGLGLKKCVGICVKVQSGWYAYDRRTKAVVAHLAPDLESAKRWVEEQCR